MPARSRGTEADGDDFWVEVRGGGRSRRWEEGGEAPRGRFAEELDDDAVTAGRGGESDATEGVDDRGRLVGRSEVVAEAGGDVDLAHSVLIYNGHVCAERRPLGVPSVGSDGREVRIAVGARELERCLEGALEAGGVVRRRKEVESGPKRSGHVDDGRGRVGSELAEKRRALGGGEGAVLVLVRAPEEERPETGDKYLASSKCSRNAWLTVPRDASRSCSAPAGTTTGPRTGRDPEIEPRRSAR